MKFNPAKIVIYLLLAAGAVAMIFPFVWMLSTSLKSPLEVLSFQFQIIPELKKYATVDDRVEQVDFQLPVRLLDMAADFEGELSTRILESDRLEGVFGIEFTQAFQELRVEIRRIFRREPYPAGYRDDLQAAIESTLGRLPALAGEHLPPVVAGELGGRVEEFQARVKEILPDYEVDEINDEFPVIFLAGPQRGETIRISPEELRFRRFLWDNYLKAWRSAPFARYFLNSIIMSVATTAGTIITSILAAYAFARMKFRYKELIFLVLLATMMVPKQVILIPNYVLLSRLDWINTFYALIVPFLAAVFGIYFMRQHFETLPQDLFDAASIDGCGRLGTLRHVVVPLSKPVIITVGLFTFIATWDALLWPLVMTNTPDMRPLQVGLAVFSQEAGTEWELLMAASTFSLLPLLVIFFIAQKHFIQGIARSGMKT